MTFIEKHRLIREIMIIKEKEKVQYCATSLVILEKLEQLERFYALTRHLNTFTFSYEKFL